MKRLFEDFLIQAEAPTIFNLSLVEDKLNYDIWSFQQGTKPLFLTFKETRELIPTLFDGTHNDLLHIANLYEESNYDLIEFRSKLKKIA